MWSHARVPNASGHLLPSFSHVAEVFAANFEDELEIGASFAAVINGELVANIRGGFANRATDQAWEENTLTCIYSSGKAVLSYLIAREVGEGRLDYDTPIAHYWPAFSQNGKETITVAQALSHQAGLCGIPSEMDPTAWLDWNAMTDRIAAMAPLWVPGTANGYHPQTFGYIAGELLRRTTGQSIGKLLSAFEVAEDLQVICGLRPDQIARASTMRKPPRAPDLGELNEFTKIAFLKKWSSAGSTSRESWMAAEIPASNMHADAPSLAMLVHPIANKGRDINGETVLDPKVINDALKERIRGDDLVLPFNLSWSSGLMRNTNRHFGPQEAAFGHAGFGGSCIVVDPENNLTAAYVMSKMSPSLVGDLRAVRLLNALYECL